MVWVLILTESESERLSCWRAVNVEKMSLFFQRYLYTLCNEQDGLTNWAGWLTVGWETWLHFLLEAGRLYC